MFHPSRSLELDDIPLSAAGAEAAPAGRAATDPASAPAVARALLDYLQLRLGAGRLGFAEPPDEIPHGWETYVYRFCLHAPGSLPPAFARPLILRIYASPQGLPRARREFAVQRHLHRRGQPVPEPLLIEEDCGLFGGPFLLMEHVPGRTLLDGLRRDWTRVLAVAGQLAEQHLRLHRLPVDGFPVPPGPFLDRRLDELESLTGTHELDGLRPGLDWLHAGRPAAPASVAIVHLDFHPVNIMDPEGREPTLLDWSEADVGDPHADVATTILLIHSAPLQNAVLAERLIAPVTRWALIRRYLRVYRQHVSLHLPTLRYYLACAALRRLAVYGMWLHAGPQANGCKPSSIRHVEPGHVGILRECFRHWTGVGVRLDV
jgi:aminoglycoside phosphotransferase (APT) family kinase protein